MSLWFFLFLFLLQSKLTFFWSLFIRRIFGFLFEFFLFKNLSHVVLRKGRRLVFFFEFFHFPADFSLYSLRIFPFDFKLKFLWFTEFEARIFIQYKLINLGISGFLTKDVSNCRITFVISSFKNGYPEFMLKKIVARIEIILKVSKWKNYRKN